jgi:hypothetical protein
MIPNPGSKEAIDAGCEWKPIPNYEDRYEVSDCGEVISLNWEGIPNRKKLLTRTIRKGPRNKVGYYIVRLFKDKNIRSVTCGRLVLEAFIGVRDDREVNHKDGNTLNDKLENLEYVTRSENQIHAVKNGLAKYPISLNNQLDCGRKYYWVHSTGTRRWATPSTIAREFNLDTAYMYKMANKTPHHLSFKGWTIMPMPNPGSDEALSINCFCPVLDNNFGAGIGKDKDGTTLFWYNSDCPIHKWPTDEAKEEEG